MEIIIYFIKKLLFSFKMSILRYSSLFLIFGSDGGRATRTSLWNTLQFPSDLVQCLHIMIILVHVLADHRNCIKMVNHFICSYLSNLDPNIEKKKKKEKRNKPQKGESLCVCTFILSFKWSALCSVK
jgi:hypothetical protein